MEEWSRTMVWLHFQMIGQAHLGHGLEGHNLAG